LHALFFFSSRRRHTRSKRDWSSDVCSSDLTWTDNTQNEDGFRVERSATTAGPWVLAGPTGANVTSFDDGQRAPEQQMCYRVVARSEERRVGKEGRTRERAVGADKNKDMKGV